MVGQGTAAQQVLAISYAGRNDWQILRVECANPHIEAAAVETSRTPGTPGLVNYNVVVKLKADAPPGYIQEQLVLVTNDYDPKAAHVPVAVEGLVASALSASPVWMGVAEAGQTVTRNLVVHGRSPFRILTVRSSDARFQCQAPAGPAGDHYILPLTFAARDPAAPPGTWRRTFASKPICRAHSRSRFPSRSKSRRQRPRRRRSRSRLPSGTLEQRTRPAFIPRPAVGPACRAGLWNNELARRRKRERFAKFGLELHPEKTRLIEFGRYAEERRATTRC